MFMTFQQNAQNQDQYQLIAVVHVYVGMNDHVFRENN